MNENTMDIEKLKERLESDDLTDHPRRVLDLILEDHERLDTERVHTDDRNRKELFVFHIGCWDQLSKG